MTVVTVLIIGEIFIDVTLAKTKSPLKMRLGGIVHAARGLWACDIKYSVAVICPDYLVEEAKAFLVAHGCDEFIWFGSTISAPNVILIDDVKEVGYQGYENLMRDKKKISYKEISEDLSQYINAIVFPGDYDLTSILSALNPEAAVTMDIAYGIKTIEDLKKIPNPIDNISISTSSDLFQSVAANDIKPLISSCKSLGAKYLLLKENRGGSRLFDLELNTTQEIYAQLNITVNSVGVGDTFTAVFGSFPGKDRIEAAWRGAQVATIYAQTTFPDDLRRDVVRELKLPLKTVRNLGGTFLSWHERKTINIYLAAPDFSYIDKPEIDMAIASLKYHNFVLRRPIQENGEARKDFTQSQLQYYYNADVKLLNDCDLVLAIPLGRDPGTLVEIGMAMALNKPVISYDPREENKNTMVICGSYEYSSDFDICLNSIFDCASKIVRRKL